MLDSKHVELITHDLEGSPQLIALKKALFNQPHSDDAKLELIRDELFSGEYQVQSQSLAEKLIQHLHLFSQPEMA